MARTAEANKLRCRAWHADNKERVNAKKRARYNADPAYADANRTRAKAWRAANPERLVADEPQKSEWRFAMMGALAALSWVALFSIAYFAAEMLRLVRA